MSIKIEYLNDIKTLFPSFVILLVQSDNKYVKSYDDDAIILSYLYKRDYRIYYDRSQISFRFENLSLVKKQLLKQKINYIIVNNYMIVECDFFRSAEKSSAYYSYLLNSATLYHLKKRNNSQKTTSDSKKDYHSNYSEEFKASVFIPYENKNTDSYSDSHSSQRLTFAKIDPKIGQKICENCMIFRAGDCWGENEICNDFRPSPGSYHNLTESD